VVENAGPLAATLAAFLTAAPQLGLAMGTAEDDVRSTSGGMALGGGGDDVLRARGNISAQLAGEAGDDRLLGGHGDDTLLGGDGNDSLQGGFGSDILFGGAGTDGLLGGGGDDVLDGGSGDDVLEGAWVSTCSPVALAETASCSSRWMARSTALPTSRSAWM
jgi:hypothetical protein